MSYWENRIAEKLHISSTQYLITHYFLPFIITKYIAIKNYITENLISDYEISFTIHTKVIHSSCNTLQGYTEVKAQNNTNCHTKKQVKAAHVNRTPYMRTNRF
jgi:hypothetical protein